MLDAFVRLHFLEKYVEIAFLVSDTEGVTLNVLELEKN